MKIIIFPLLILTSVQPELSPSVQPQICNDKLAATTPVDRFHGNNDGSVTDKKTGLSWARCSLGQRWIDNTCDGNADKISYAAAALFSGEGWRLPTIHELSGIVELRCTHPAISQEVFPNTPLGNFWTSSRFINEDGKFWLVNFIYGESVSEKADSVAFVRWVRDKE